MTAKRLIDQLTFLVREHRHDFDVVFAPEGVYRGYYYINGIEISKNAMERDVIFLTRHQATGLICVETDQGSIVVGESKTIVKSEEKKP